MHRPLRKKLQRREDSRMNGDIHFKGARNWFSSYRRFERCARVRTYEKL